jgi:hypothetical protein
VLSNACVSCPAGTTNAAGDDASGADTTCDATLCGTDERVSSNACVPCPAGTTNAAGDDASGSNTTCDATLCGTDERVSSNACVPCPPGTGNLAGDDASGADTTCDLTLESEPNDDGATAIGTDDFSSANADGPFSTDVVIRAGLGVAGDEDVFAFTNTGTAGVTVLISVSDGAVCSFAGTVFVRDAAGTVESSIGTCLLFVLSLDPGVTRYVHVVEAGDDTAVPLYFLSADFVTP